MCGVSGAIDWLRGQCAGSKAGGIIPGMGEESLSPRIRRASHLGASRKGLPGVVQSHPGVDVCSRMVASEGGYEVQCLSRVRGVLSGGKVQASAGDAVRSIVEDRNRAAQATLVRRRVERCSGCMRWLDDTGGSCIALARSLGWDAVW